MSTTTRARERDTRIGFEQWRAAVRWWNTDAKPRLFRWWKAQTDGMRVAVAAAAVLVAAVLLNLTATGFTRLTSSARPTGAPSVSQTTASPLRSEAAPPDAGKVWSVRGLWQGSTGHETEAFTVVEHWRVDWVFSPAPSGGTLQVFIFRADGRLLTNIAANTQTSGADSSFWAGPGTYFLKINSSGGDWKVDVQDLR